MICKTFFTQSPRPFTQLEKNKKKIKEKIKLRHLPFHLFPQLSFHGGRGGIALKIENKRKKGKLSLALHYFELIHGNF